MTIQLQSQAFQEFQLLLEDKLVTIRRSKKADDWFTLLIHSIDDLIDDHVLVTGEHNEQYLIYPDRRVVEFKTNECIGRIKDNPFYAQLVVEGTAQDGTYSADGRKAPFTIFCPQLQRNVGGPYAERSHARAAVKLIRNGTIQPYTDGDASPFIFTYKPKQD